MVKNGVTSAQQGAFSGGNTDIVLEVPEDAKYPAQARAENGADFVRIGIVNILLFVSALCFL